MSKITIKQLRDGSPWDNAKRLGIAYTGDSSTIPHGGTFYETKNWQQYGYAECLQFCESEGTLWVERGTINRPSDIAPCLGSSGWVVNSEGQVVQEHNGDLVADEVTPELEIECVLGHWGMDVDSTDTYIEKDYSFPEFKIWQECREYLVNLADQ